jgi:RNAse (barnase) inhibitor barstar
VAPFRKDDLVNDELEYDLPFRLMQNSPVALYKGREVFESDIRDLRSRGFEVPRFDCRAWTTENALHDALRVGLKLPDYTGQNFDALDDSLTDIVVPEATGLMVALDNVTDAPRADVLVDVLARASRYWLLFGRIFGVLARTDRPDLAPAQVGAMRPVRRWEPPN